MLKKTAAFQILAAQMDRVPTLVDRSFGNQRTAARHEFQYTPRPGYLYVRSRAISSRVNDNFDGFPAAEIEKGYLTFIGKPVFVNHVNDDHRRARGVIIDAALHRHTNPDGSPDTWAEVLMEVDAINFPKLAKAILAKRIDRTSMGVDVDHSICSKCANKATTPSEYCQHVPQLKGTKFIRRNAATGMPEQGLIFESCFGLRFFENSLLVEEPADPTAFFTGVDSSSMRTASKTAAHPEESEQALSREPTHWQSLEGLTGIPLQIQHAGPENSKWNTFDHERIDFKTPAWGDRKQPVKDLDDVYDRFAPLKQSLNAHIPFNEDDRRAMEEMHYHFQHGRDQFEHAEKRVVNLDDPIDLKQHMIEAHDLTDDDFWRNSHEDDHPALDPAHENDRPLSFKEIRSLHDHDHASGEYAGHTLGDSHFHVAVKRAVRSVPAEPRHAMPDRTRPNLAQPHRAEARQQRTAAKRSESVSKPDDLKDALDGVSLSKDAQGYFVHTHRARSKSYETPHQIPKSRIEFIRSTGSMSAFDRAMARAANIRVSAGYLNADDSDYKEHWAVPAGKAPYDALEATHKHRFADEAPDWPGPDLDPSHGPWHLTRHPETRAHQVVDNQNREVVSHKTPGSDEQDHSGRDSIVSTWKQINHAHGYMSDHEAREDDRGDAEMRQPQPPFKTVHEDPLTTERKSRPKAPIGAGSGHSPEDEWHGPYQVHQHPETGKYHVLDNQGRNTGHTRRQGWDEQHEAEWSRDHVNRRTQSKEEARGIANGLMDGMANVLSGGEHKTWDEATQAHRTQQHMDSMNDLMHTYEGSDGKFGYDEDPDDDGEPYHEVKSKSGSGWTARDYGGTNVHIHHEGTPDQAHEMYSIGGGMEGGWGSPGTKPPGWNHTHLHDVLHKFEHGDPEEEGDTGIAKEHEHYGDPAIARWQKQKGFRRQAARASYERHDIKAKDIQEGDRLDSSGKTRVDSRHPRQDKVLVRTKTNGSRSPSVQSWDHEDDVKVWRQASKIAIGETRAPDQVDTLRIDTCPVCGNENYDGGRCDTCSFDPPPAMFTDPDLTKAKQLDRAGDGMSNSADPAFEPDQGGMMGPQDQPVDPEAVGPDGQIDVDVQTLEGQDDPAAAEQDQEQMQAVDPAQVGPDGQVDLSAADQHFNQGGEAFTPGPNAPTPEQPLDPEALTADGEVPPGEAGTSGYPGDGVADLLCPACGFSADGATPTSVGSDQMAPTDLGDGMQDGAVCPQCGQATLMSPKEAQQVAMPV